ncbi:MAG: hypothetical protein ABWZ87_05895 [Aeromicrobium sp.]
MREDPAELYGEPQTMVLYATPEAWRYCLYTDRVSLEGALREWVAPDEAQREAARIADGFFGRPLHLQWDIFDPGWWVAHVEGAPFLVADGVPDDAGEAGDLPHPIP